MKSPPFHLLLDSRLLFNSLTLLLALAAGSSVRAADQTWNNNAANLLWSTSAANWDAGVVWTNGNSALFGSMGAGTLNVDGTINVTSLTFSANGYIIGDADNNGTLTLGSGSVITVASGISATISEVIAGTNGFTKSGAGTLTLSGATSPATGNTLVEAGTLAWGANDALPSGTVTVLSGATVDLTALSGNNNAATSSGRAYVIAGTGVSGLGAIVNNSGSLLSDAAISSLTLTADATISTGARLDISGTPNLGSFTLTKIGAERLPFRSTVNSPERLAGDQRGWLLHRAGQHDHRLDHPGERHLLWHVFNQRVDDGARGHGGYHDERDQLLAAGIQWHARSAECVRRHHPHQWSNGQSSHRWLGK